MDKTNIGLQILSQIIRVWGPPNSNLGSEYAPDFLCQTTSSMSAPHASTSSWVPAKSWQHFIAGGYAPAPPNLTPILLIFNFRPPAVSCACAAPSSRAPLTWSRHDCSRTSSDKNTPPASAHSSETASCSSDDQAVSYGTLSRRHTSSGCVPPSPPPSSSPSSQQRFILFFFFFP
jgi:hypothetical protein